jgi:hypothetical protein
MAYLPIPEQIAIGLDFPPALISELGTLPMDYARKNPLTGAEREIISHALTAALIPFFWVWVIRITAARQRTRLKFSSFAKASIIIAIVFLSILAILALGQILMVGGHYSSIRDIFFLAWFLWGIFILTLRLKRNSAKTSIATGN